MLQGTVLPGDTMRPFWSRSLLNMKHLNGAQIRTTGIWWCVRSQFSSSATSRIWNERIRKLPEYRLKNYYIRELLVLLGASQLLMPSL